MRLLVTGASGFLGRAFAEAALAQGHEVHALVRRPSAALEHLGLQPILRDILELTADDLPSALEAVVHFATGVDGDEDHVVEVAVEGTLRLLEAAQARDVERFVHVSSMSVYSSRTARRELEPRPEARGGYARSKVLAEAALVERLRAEPDSGPQVTIVRPGLVFGPGMTSALAGTAVELPLGLSVGLGRRRQGVPFVTTADLNAGLLSLIQSASEPGVARAFDILSGRPPAKGELVAIHEELCGRPRRTIWVPLPVALAAAAALDGLHAVRRRPRRAWYGVRRLYRFEPASLDAEVFWRAIGHDPTGDLRTALRTSLTATRVEPVTMTTGDPRRHLSELLAGPARSVAGEPVPLVLVGAGRIAAEMHVPALERLGGYTVSAIVDPDVALAQRLAAAFPGCGAVSRLDALDDNLLARAAVVVASPGYTHHAVALEAAGRGASLLLEKPAALTSEAYVELCDLGEARARPITVFHNYRLRPGSRALWHFLAEHDVGRLLRAQVVFHSPRLERERARWMREEKRHRILLMELAVHLIDLVCVVGGELTDVLDLSVVDDRRTGNTLSVSAATLSEQGARIDLDLDLSGVAARSQIVFSFERATCAVDLFPDGFRILPRRANPVDDLASDARRFAAALSPRLRRRRHGVPVRALPHREIYRRHLGRLSQPGRPDPFSLEAVGPTMRSLFLLCDAVYPPRSQAERLPLSQTVGGSS